MANTRLPFTVKEPEICVKCAKEMPIGTPVTWLRETDRKGYYHIECEGKPTIRDLTRVKRKDSADPMGYRWVRQREIPVAEQVRVPQQVAVAPVTPAVGHDAIIDAMTEAVMFKLMKKIGTIGPRIIVNVFVPKVGDEQAALELLSKELFTLGKVQTI